MYRCRSRSDIKCALQLWSRSTNVCIQLFVLAYVMGVSVYYCIPLHSSIYDPEEKCYGNLTHYCSIQYMLCGPSVVAWLCSTAVTTHLPPAPSQPSLQVCKVWPIKGGLLVERKVTGGMQSSDLSQE